MKQIQIPEELFNRMALFILDEDFRTEEHEKIIKKGILEKFD